MRTNWKKNIFEINNLIEKAEQISILIHYNPDGDAIGSGLALYHFLKSKKDKVNLISPNGFPEFLHWMPGTDKIICADKEQVKAYNLLSQSSLVFILDFNHADRINDMETHLLSINATKVMIDHHPDPQNFCQYTLSDVTASSTAELIYEFIKMSDESGVIGKDIASSIYVGIMTDTGNFSYNSSNPDTFTVIADLLRSGIDKDKITSSIYDNFSADRMRLLGLSLNERMIVLPEYHTAFIALRRKDLYKYNFKQGDSEGFVNYPLSIKGVIFSALFIEHKDHVKISFRSKGSFRVNNFSKNHFNGGGHKNAAGGNMTKSMDETLQLFEQLLPQYLDELRKSENE